MKNKKIIIAVILLWIPLAYVVYIHSADETPTMRLVMSVLSGPVLAFFAGLGALAVSALELGAVYILDKLDWSKGGEVVPYTSQFGIFFSGAFGVLIAILYYLTITNQHLFYRIYGGW